MKYLAILRDSFREAIDAKVFYVMLALSSLMILFVGSISYRPVTMEEEMRHLTEMLNWIGSVQQLRAAPRYEVADFRRLNDAAEPWRGDYRFDFRVQLSSQKDADQWAEGLRQTFGRRLGGGSLQEVVADLYRSSFPWLEQVEVVQGASPDPKELRFTVTTRGTKITTVRGWIHEPALFFGALPLSFLHAPLGGQVLFVEGILINTIGAWVAVLIGVIITAFFVPNMLRKGTVDLLISKPIHRSTLLVWKYLGGLSFMFFNTAFVVLGVWLVIGLRSGIWGTGFLLTIPVLTFFFAILYAVSVLFGVLTRSTVVAILGTCAVWLVLFLVGWGYQHIDSRRQPQQYAGWVYPTVDTLHFVLPRTRDLSSLTAELLARDALLNENPHLREDRPSAFNWAESLTVSGAFIAVMLGLSCWHFATRDY